MPLWKRRRTSGLCRYVTLAKMFVDTVIRANQFICSAESNTWWEVPMRIRRALNCAREIECAYNWLLKFKLSTLSDVSL